MQSIQQNIREIVKVTFQPKAPFAIPTHKVAARSALEPEISVLNRWRGKSLSNWRSSSVQATVTSETRNILNARTASLRMNQTLNGSLNLSDRMNPRRFGTFSDDYTLTGMAVGQQVRLNLASAAFDPYLQLIDGSGRIITANDDRARGETGAEITFQVRAGISYRVRVTSFAMFSLGGYTLSANAVNQTNTLGTIALNQPVAGTLTSTDNLNSLRPDTFADDYRLMGISPGQQVQINLNAARFDPYLQLVNGTTGQLIAFDDDSGPGFNSQLSFTAQAGVNYTLRVTSYARNATGAYTLSVRSSVSVPPSRFNPVRGYGLVNAANAIARAIGQSPFENVPLQGGANWGNDLINAPAAWNRGYTGRGVVVAVIDSGVDVNHPDLRDNIWRNEREIAGNGIDDDGNGFVDDVNGWNFGIGQNNNNVLPGSNSSGQGHGTHVAGIIAAARNDIGITGTAYNAQIMPIRLGNVDSRGRFTNAGDLGAAIRYAVNNGARVINMSLGWSDIPGLREALAFAASRNVLTVSAAGNSALNAPGIPASYATNFGLSVGAVDQVRAIAPFSNRAGVDSRMQHVVAPGVNVFSTLPNGQYGNLSGTSMAAPYVAGAAALLLSANPNLTADQMRRFLTDTAA